MPMQLEVGPAHLLGHIPRRRPHRVGDALALVAVRDKLLVGVAGLDVVDGPLRVRVRMLHRLVPPPLRHLHAALEAVEERRPLRPLRRQQLDEVHVRRDDEGAELLAARANDQHQLAVQILDARHLWQLELFAQQLDLRAHPLGNLLRRRALEHGQRALMHRRGQLALGHLGAEGVRERDRLRLGLLLRQEELPHRRLLCARCLVRLPLAHRRHAAALEPRRRLLRLKLVPEGEDARGGLLLLLLLAALLRARAAARASVGRGRECAGTALQRLALAAVLVLGLQPRRSLRELACEVTHCVRRRSSSVRVNIHVGK
mmetsp:Transcript_49347/g.155001  ORF Transcript_49347/g.155001 Transcript_49347/m.155001 type:complete len:316 (-) Transcript_49347:6-953(-)